MNLIDREELRERSMPVREFMRNNPDLHVVSLNQINRMPTIDAEPVRHGEREHVTVWHSAAWGELYTVYKCCGFRERGKTWHNYCPNCGAKMRGGEDAG